MCNKVSYNSKSEAVKDSKFILVNSKRYGGSNPSRSNKGNKLRPYLCPICQMWHLTSLSPNVTRTWGKKNAIINKIDKQMA